jgi:hypothetical protein
VLVLGGEEKAAMRELLFAAGARDIGEIGEDIA